MATRPKVYVLKKRKHFAQHIKNVLVFHLFAVAVYTFLFNLFRGVIHNISGSDQKNYKF